MSNCNGVAHIKSPDNPDMSYCGCNVVGMFCLVDREHAESCIKNNTYVQPCKRCLAKASADTATEKDTGEC